MQHLHGDLLAITRRVTELVGSDRVASSSEDTRHGVIDIVLDDLGALDEFATFHDAPVRTTESFGGFESRSSFATVNGIAVKVTASGMTTAVAS